MKKGILVAVALCAAAAWAANLNPVGGNTCGAGGIDTNPSTIQGGLEFAKIYENLIARVGDAEMWKINTDDTTWWSSGDLEYDQEGRYRNWAYMMVKFIKPQGYDTGTLNWCVKVQGGADIYAYRWDTDPDIDYWAYMNKNNGGSAPPTKTYTIPASYFDANGVLWLLFKGNGNPSWLQVDVVDIHW
jgi:hypothetical protein